MKTVSGGYGFDIRANEATYGKVQVINNGRYGGRLPIKDGKVDCVFMLAVLEHLTQGSFLIDEAVRVLKKGGCLIITTPTPMAKPLLEFLSFRLHVISEESIREHQHYYTKKELLKLMRGHGCQVEAYKKFQFGMNELVVAKKE